MSKSQIAFGKLKAFTVMELVVVMILTSIIVFMALQFYLYYQNLISRKNNQMNCGKTTIQFYQVFKHEFDNATEFTTSGNIISLPQPNQTTIHYQIDQDIIVRNYYGLLDTFHVQVNDFDIAKNKATGVDEIITMQLVSCGEIYPVYLFKQYSNDALMNIECK